VDTFSCEKNIGSSVCPNIRSRSGAPPTVSIKMPPDKYPARPEDSQRSASNQPRILRSRSRSLSRPRRRLLSPCRRPRRSSLAVHRSCVGEGKGREAGVLTDDALASVFVEQRQNLARATVGSTCVCSIPSLVTSWLPLQQEIQRQAQMEHEHGCTGDLNLRHLRLCTGDLICAAAATSDLQLSARTRRSWVRRHPRSAPSDAWSAQSSSRSV